MNVAPLKPIPKAQNASLLEGFAQGAVGASAGAAASHPLDLLKVRMQIQGEGTQSAPRKGMIGIARSIMSAEGVPGLYAGLSASLARQVVYSGTRFGMYDVIKGRLHTAGEGPMPLHTKVLAALGAGACGAGAANPYDLAMVRMQADGRLAAGERRGYRNVADAVVKIGRAEGAAALWSGVAPNVNRAMIVTVGHLAVYDEAKAQLVRGGALGGDGVGVHLAAGLTSAVAASALSHPVDVAKTRLMNQRGAYRGMLHCLVMTFRNEGALALYKGFIPTLARQVPYVVVTWVTAEQVARLFRAAKA